ncbi:MAG: hypothetical protein ABS35_37685 [Kaistia sp. SCN 65-12]|nr:MAG: hypothetical protein ABS35_37685 [Kaistia sp. SCN 65-12]
MSSWKENVQVRDLDPGQRLEITCKVCGHVHYLTRDLICVSAEREFLYLDEVERQTICRARGCRGSVRLALVRNGDTSAFVGGLA